MEQKLYDSIINNYTELVSAIAVKKAEIKIDFKNRNGKYHTETKIKKGLKAHLICDTEVTTNLAIEPQREKIKELIKDIRTLSNKLIPINEEINRFLNEQGFVDRDKINSIQIDKDNLHLYYNFMSDEDLKKYSSLIWIVISNRFQFVKEELILCDTIYRYDNDIILFYSVDNSKIGISIFGIKDVFKPIEEYIKEIKNSNDYKQYRFNNLVKTYDLSISHLKRLEHELFADDSKYKSNIDNLIYAALDNIADDFKMNVINYIEENHLQEETGINCISDIPVVIKDGEFQGLFKEFESYGLNDFSVQNITMFIDRLKELN